MKKKITEQPIKRRKVKFSIEAPEAAQVNLMGDFNGWNLKTHPMKNDGNGVWARTLMLPAGKYEYKFLIDGHWDVDPANDQTCPNKYGTVNSVIYLS